MNWSRSIHRALGAKSKMEFLDGTLPEPDHNSSYYKQWIKTDYMIFSWIINSISKELANAFSHIESTRKLCVALNKRFGRCNGPKTYKLQREIFVYSQGNQSVVQYFNNLTALWDVLMPPLDCRYGVKRTTVKRDEQQKMFKFLHDLNNVFERARSQMLLLEALPDLDMAYSMILQVEDELMLNGDMSDNQNMFDMNVGDTFYVHNQGSSYQNQNPLFVVGSRPSGFKRRLTKEEKKRLKCKHCHESGHEIDECFKLHDVPDWYRRYKKNRDNIRLILLMEMRMHYLLTLVLSLKGTIWI